MTRTAIAALVLSAAPAFAQNFIDTDTTIHDNLCLGRDCLEDEIYPSFGGTLMLKWQRNNIQFIDTSDAADGFPDGDWKLRANDDGAGGENFFAIEDFDAGTVPFRIKDGATSNSLVVGAQAIGVGTLLPQREMHLVDTFSAALRLEQSGGIFGNGAWDLSATATGFSLRDATANTTPLFVSATVPNNALTLIAPNKIGMGTLSPEAALHVLRDDNTAALLIEETGAGTLGQLTLRNNGITYFTLEDTSIAAGDNTGRAWNFQNQGGTFRVTTAPGGPGEIEMQMTPAGDMLIKGQLYTGTGGATTTCDDGCDRVFDADYTLPSIADHHAQMMQDKHLPAVGPTPENGPYNLSQMTGGMLNELEKAHLYIAQLEATVRTQSELMHHFESRLTALESGR